MSEKASMESIEPFYGYLRMSISSQVFHQIEIKIEIMTCIRELFSVVLSRHSLSNCDDDRSEKVIIIRIIIVIIIIIIIIIIIMRRRRRRRRTLFNDANIFTGGRVHLVCFQSD